jgi:hypothetical protein
MHAEPAEGEIVDPAIPLYSEINPFIQPINQNDIDFEDTILVGDPGADIETFELVKVDS